MGDYVVHRARFFEFQPKAIQSMSYDDNLKKLAVEADTADLNLIKTGGK